MGDSKNNTNEFIFDGANQDKQSNTSGTEGINEAQQDNRPMSSMGTGLGSKLNLTLGLDNTASVQMITTGIKTLLTANHVDGVVHNLNNEGEYKILAVTFSHNNKVFAKPIIVEASGRKPQSASEIINYAAAMNPNSQPVFFTANLYTKEMIDLINKEVGAKVNDNIIQLFPIIVPFDLTNEQDFLIFAQEHIFEPMVREAAIKLGADTNISIVEEVKNGTRFELTVDRIIDGSKLPSSHITPTANDFNCSLIKRNDQHYRSLLNKSIGIVLSIGGRLDTILSTKQIQAKDRMVTDYRPAPLIILDSFNGLDNTLEYFLLALAASTALTSQGNYMEFMLPKGKKSDDVNNYGALNVLFNIEGKDGTGEAIDLTSPKVDLAATLTYLNDLIVDEPYIAVDIDILTRDTTKYLTILDAADSSKSADVRTKAIETILKTSHNITGGQFPLGFDKNQVVNSGTIITPSGFYINNAGNKVDLKTIDAVYLANISPDLAAEWYKSIEATNVLEARIKILSDLSEKMGGEIIITGYSHLVFFNPAFLMELAKAVTATGFSIKLDARVDTSVIRPHDMGFRANTITTAFGGGVHQGIQTHGFQPMRNHFNTYQSRY